MHKKGDTTLKDELKVLVSVGGFTKARELLKNMNIDEIRDALLELSYDTGSIAPYSFICSILCDEESADFHYLASALLSISLNHLVGAYNAGLYHARRAVELAPEDASFKEYLLFFHNIPEELITKEEAIEIAKEVVKQIPNSKVALDILNK